MTDPLPFDVSAHVRASLPGLGRVTAALGASGHTTWLVGPALLHAIAGRPMRTATLWTNAPSAEIAARLPHAVQLAGDHRSWCVPNGAKPLHLRALDRPVASALEWMPLRALALAFECERGAWCDPTGALDEVRARRLSLQCDPAEGAARDPLLVLRAATLAAEHDLSLAASDARRLEAALPGLDRAPAAHLTVLLRVIMRSRGAAAGLALLDDAGLRSAWLGAAATRAEAASIDEIGSLPVDFALRLLAWAGGSRPTLLLRRLRLDAGTRARLVRLGEHHPVDERHPSLRPRALRRLLDRLGEADFDALVALRRIELRHASDPEAAARAAVQLDALTDARTALTRPGERGPAALAVRGRDLIEALALTPGPAVGRLLARLDEEVTAGRVANERDPLLDCARAFCDTPDPCEPDRAEANRGEPDRGEPG